MKTIEDLRGAGYGAEAAMFLDHANQPTVYFVSGYGMQTYVAENDNAAITALIESPACRYGQMTRDQLLAALSDLDDEHLVKAVVAAHQ